MPHDLRFAIRQLLRTPGFTLMAVLTLALGIGATTTLVSVVDTLMFKAPAGVVEPQRVVRPYLVNVGWTGATVSYPDFVELQRGVKAFSHVAAVFGGRSSLGHGAGAQGVRVDGVTGDFFTLLGAVPIRGRVLTPDDDQSGAAGSVVVVSEGFWRRNLGGAEDVLSRTLEVADKHYQVVGVMPKGFTGGGLEGPDLWVPFGAVAPAFAGPEYATQHGYYFMYTLARLGPAASTAQAEAQGTAAILTARSDTSDRNGFQRMIVGPIQAARGPEAGDTPQLAELLLGVSVLVLLLACANVANLLLARGLERGRELAIRKALGAGQGRLLRQLMSEGLLLGMLGGVAALLLATWGGAVVRSLLLPAGAAADFSIDGRVFGVALVVSLLAGLLAGALPAWRAARGNLNAMIKDGAPAAAGSRSRLRTSLVVAQVAISVLLVAGTGLFVRSLRNALSLDLGMDVKRVVTLNVDLGAAGFAPADIPRAFDAMRNAVLHAPGVEQAALSVGSPFSWSFANGIKVPGRDSLPRPKQGGPYTQSVTANYFATMGQQVLRGRGLEQSDRKGSARVAVISQGLATLYWPDADPLGRCVMLAQSPDCTTIVGIVKDGRRNQIIEPPAAMIFVPLAQVEGPITQLTLFARGRDGVQNLAATLRPIAQAAYPNLPFVRVRAMSDQISSQYDTWRLGATLFGAFGVLGLLLAAIGVYGALAYRVRGRTRELGIRLALGAESRKLAAMVMGEGMRLTAVGIGIGVVIALAAGRALQALLYGVSVRDPIVLLTTAGVLLTAALLAGWLPARRATRVDPMVALRSE
ncbi:MAG: ABC transporter permease [Gemmatimonadota bacterium]